MELLQISGQRSKSLFEFYNPNEWPLQWGKMPEMMCQLITSLQLIEHDPTWVFTSHAQLLFTNRDDYEDWQVLVQVIDINKIPHYKITVAQENPWHHLTGFSDNHADAAELVISGLSVSAIGKNRNIFLDAN
jgi:hypothetical protein